MDRLGHCIFDNGFRACFGIFLAKSTAGTKDRNRVVEVFLM
jgi:hypothetical protein